MMLDRQEFCTECGDPTGRAGNFHDQLYVKIPDESGLLVEKGPLCDECAEHLSREYQTEIIRR